MTDAPQSRQYAALAEALGRPHSDDETALTVTLAAWLLDEEITVMASMVRRLCGRRTAHYRGLVVEVAERLTTTAAGDDVWVVVTLPVGLARRVSQAVADGGPQ
jgi:hypothetical protein